MPKYASYLLIALLLGIGGFYLYNKYNVPPSIDLSKLDLVNLNGEPFDFKSLKGKKTIVCFSASWCPNCINEMNALSKIKNTELADIEIVIIDDEPLEMVAHFKERKNYPFTFLKLNRAFPEIGINSIPVTYFYNAAQELKKDEVGEIEWSDPSTREHYKQVMN